MSMIRTKRLGKKGAMVVTQTLTTILIILGFAILLYIFYRIYSTTAVDVEACHESAVFRATAGYIAPTILSGVTKSYIPLKCKTAKICITSKLFGGECEDFKGEKGVTKIRVSSGDKGVQDIERIYAQEILSCWTMMGEGKIDLFSSYRASELGLGLIYPSCIICSRIALDTKSLKDDNVDLSKIDVEGYMASHLVPDKDVTYLQYIGGKKVSVSKIEFKEDVKGEGGQEIIKSGTLLEPKDISELPKDNSLLDKEHAILFMQVTAPKHGESTLEIGNVLFGTTLISFALAPIGTAKSLFTLGKGVVAHPGVAALILAIAGATQQGMVAYNRYIAAGYCGDVSTGGEARNGCSVVRTVVYNANDIAQYCPNIESIP